MTKEQEQPLQEISFDELKLMVADGVADYQYQIGVLEGLVQKAEFGFDHNFRVHIFTDGEQIQVELETKPAIGFRT